MWDLGGFLAKAAFSSLPCVSRFPSQVRLSFHPRLSVRAVNVALLLSDYPTHHSCTPRLLSLLIPLSASLVFLLFFSISSYNHKLTHTPPHLYLITHSLLSPVHMRLTRLIALRPSSVTSSSTSIHRPLRSSHEIRSICRVGSEPFPLFLTLILYISSLAPCPLLVDMRRECLSSHSLFLAECLPSPPCDQKLTSLSLITSVCLVSE